MFCRLLKAFFLIFLLFGVFGFGKVNVMSKPIKAGGLDSHNTFIGTIKFKENSRIASQSTGVVEDVFFSVGQKVSKGDKLVVLSSDLLSKNIESKEAKLAQAKLLKELGEKELLRYKNLLESDSIAPQQYEKLSYDVRSQELNILSLEAELQQAKVELEKKTIRAPFDGVIVDKKVNIGEWISVGGEVCVVLNNSQPEARIDVPSTILEFIKVDDKVSLEVNQKKYTGKISAIIPKADSRSRTFPVIISMKSNDSFIDGMAVSAMLKSGGKSEGFIVPRDSIVQYFRQSTIFVVRNNRALAINVDVLGIQGNLAVVNGAIKGSDRVVYRGQDRLQDGVEVTEALKAVQKR